MGRQLWYEVNGPAQIYLALNKFYGMQHEARERERENPSLLLNYNVLTQVYGNLQIPHHNVQITSPFNLVYGMVKL